MKRSLVGDQGESNNNENGAAIVGMSCETWSIEINCEFYCKIGRVQVEQRTQALAAPTRVGTVVLNSFQLHNLTN